MISSKKIIDLITEETTSMFLGLSTDASKKVSSAEVQKSRTKEFTQDGSVVPKGKSEVVSFFYSPLDGKCTWYEKTDGKDTSITLKFIDVDFWMFNTGNSTHVNYPGIYLTIRHNININYGSGSKYNPNDVTTYVYAPSFRSRITPTSQDFSTLCNRARGKGLVGIEFPKNWDVIPYII